MAHGLESRVPFLDHPLVELAATMPADVKFEGGQLKHMLQHGVRAATAAADHRAQGQDGLPDPARTLDPGAGARLRPGHPVVRRPRSSGRWSTTGGCSPRWTTEPRSGASFWGLLSLELWQQEFHDRRRSSGICPQRVQGRACRLRVLITGGAGFVGSHLADRLLARGDEVLVIDNYATGRRDNLRRRARAARRRGRHRRRSGSSSEAFSSFAPEVVVHAAASYKDPDDWAEDVADERRWVRPTSSRRPRTAACRRLDLLPDGALLRPPPARAADHARPPDPSGRQQLRHQQDGGRALRRA